MIRNIVGFAIEIIYILTFLFAGFVSFMHFLPDHYTLAVRWVHILLAEMIGMGE